MCVALALVLSGCATTLTDKRTSYKYAPTYGVDSAEFRRSLDALGTEMAPHNRVVLLENGDEFFPAMLSAIHGARHSINMEMYIFDHGRTATEFAHALGERAQAGVAVRLLVDGLGGDLGPLADELRASGVKLEIYRPLWHKFFNLEKRTHRKLLTVDGRIGFCGGAGIDDRWRGAARNPHEWREAMVQLEGPVVAQLQAIFMEDWTYASGEVLHGDEQFPPLTPAGTMLAQAVASSGGDASSRAHLLYYMAIQAARRRIWIENAYFVPSKQLRRALIEAVRRGVEVKILVPGKHIDVALVRMASRFHYDELLDGGVQVHEYTPTMLHNKVMVVDGVWTTIGSINLVSRSMKTNAEANVIVYEHGFAGRVEAMIADDLAHAQRLTRQRWERRGALARTGELVSWLFSENY